MAEENVFDTMTKEYDAWYDSDDGKTLYKNELKCLEPLIPKTCRPLLDIGVGTGRFAMHFPGAYGVDSTFNALKIAQTRGIRCVRSRGESLPFMDRTFGTVLIITTLCFAKEPLSLLQEARRVLTAEGCIIIGLIPKDSSWGVLYEEKKRSGSPFYRSARFYTLDDVEDLVKKADLEILRIRSTLLQDSAGPARVEEPHEGLLEGAGFVCVKAGSQ